LPPVHRFSVCVTKTEVDLVVGLARLEFQNELLRARLEKESNEHAYDDSSKSIKRMRDCLDEKLQPAMAVADNDELKKALKDYYVAAQSAIDSIRDGAEKRAQSGQAFDEASNRLHLEAVTAGKW
jgi:hypothetical protein